MTTFTQRRYVERKIAARCISELLDAGFEITVNDGEEDTVEFSKNPAEIIGAMFTTDEDYLIVSDQTGLHKGWVRFIYGNDGPDVIADYTTSLESSLMRTNALAEAENTRLFG